jgi:putative endonuclease
VPSTLKTDPERRRQAERLGRFAETQAALYLMLKGYRIVARRVKTPLGELDLIARRGDTLAIVEVKSRATLDAGVEAVSPRQQARIVRGTQSYLAMHPALAELTIRFDILAVAGWLSFRHVLNAWQV